MDLTRDSNAGPGANSVTRITSQQQKPHELHCTINLDLMVVRLAQSRRDPGDLGGRHCHPALILTELIRSLASLGSGLLNSLILISIGRDNETGEDVPSGFC
jgi:hypothetical protein